MSWAPSHSVSSPRARRFSAFDHGEEVVAGQLAQLAREDSARVREEDLRLRVPAGVEQDLPSLGYASRVLEADAGIVVPERDPATLAAPADVDDLLAVGKQRFESRARLR